MPSLTKTLCWFLLFSAGVAAAAPTPRTALLVLSKADHTLAIVDPNTLQVVARMPVGEDPHEVIASSDGRFAYVSNYGFGAYHTLALLDLVQQKALPSIDLGPLRGPHGLFVADGKVWFTAEGAKVIGRFDPAANKVDWILGTGQNRTHMIWLSPDRRRIVTTNVASATVTIIDQVERRSPPPPPGAAPHPPMPSGPRPPMPSGPDWNETVIPVGRGSEGFDVSPDGREIWVGNAGDGTVSILNMADKKVVETLNADVSGVNRLKFSPDGKQVFISSLSKPTVAVLDAATRKEVKQINLGGGAAGIQIQPDGTRVYVASTAGNYVAVIDPKTLAIIGRIDAGPQPDGLAWAVQQ